MHDQLEQIIEHKEQSVVIRVYKSDKARLDALQRRLTIQAGGQPVSQAQVIRYLLDLASSKSNKTVNNG